MFLYKKFKKIFLLMCLLFIFFYFLFSSDVYSTVSGDCDACHKLFPGLLDEKARKKLPSTNILCVECHSSDEKESIKIIGRSRVPVVFNKKKVEKFLSGGNFLYVTTNDRKGHNVNGTVMPDLKLGNEPPGYERKYDPSKKGYNKEKPLTCAGSNGCHGDRDIEDPFDAIKGSHHATDRPIDGSSTARSYRFLKGVKGLEDSDWGINSSSEKHNEYSEEINTFCLNCHGQFHSEMGQPDLWFRHPTGITLPEEKGYEKYKEYDPQVPVGRKKIPEKPSREVKAGEDVVICLSCHMAHASPYDSLLRWDYDNIYVHEKDKKGCLVCHTTKQ